LECAERPPTPISSPRRDNAESLSNQENTNNLNQFQPMHGAGTTVSSTAANKPKQSSTALSTTTTQPHNQNVYLSPVPSAPPVLPPRPRSSSNEKASSLKPNPPVPPPRPRSSSNEATHSSSSLPSNLSLSSSTPPKNLSSATPTLHLRVRFQ
jgi:hypothetical protein